MTDAPLPYVSTRGASPLRHFTDTMLDGLAPDGGLYVPADWPSMAALEVAAGGYVPLAQTVMWPFVAGTIDPIDFECAVTEAYATFDIDDVVSLVDLGDDIHLVELFHGPTLAFKDVALQLLGRLFDLELTRRDERVTIVGATSGDTGSAAIEACRDRDALDIVILHPAGRVSEVQRRQMTTVDSDNVHNVAVEGTFDDCQDLLKAMFADTAFRDRVRLSAVNSINWARVMAQIVYYAWAAYHLGPSVTFTVPTGNFGNVFAGEAARRMGLDVGGFLVASNRNDILTRFFRTGGLEMSDVEPSLSPSMDIQVSSNLERLLFELYDRDGSAVAELMGDFRVNRRATVDARCFARLGGRWLGECLDDTETLAVIAETHRRHGLLIDPHTAVGLGAAQRRRAEIDGPVAVLSTAHPAKFPDAVEQATGVRPTLPERLADLFDRPEHCESLPADLSIIEAHVESLIEHRAAS
jgi:threonine synthase